MAVVRAHVFVRGLVQGVFFRAHVKKLADSLGVKGWVRNLPDGETVELVAEGERDSVEKLVCWCLRGPPLARVLEVSVKFAEPTGEFKDFKILR
ncbi:MAG: acylphosphatase [Acidilobaceae archaeon]